MSEQERCSCLNPPSRLQMESLPKGEVLEVESNFLSQPGRLLLMKLAEEAAPVFRNPEQLLEPVKPCFYLCHI